MIKTRWTYDWDLGEGEVGRIEWQEEPPRSRAILRLGAPIVVDLPWVVYARYEWTQKTWATAARSVCVFFRPSRLLDPTSGLFTAKLPHREMHGRFCMSRRSNDLIYRHGWDPITVFWNSDNTENLDDFDSLPEYISRELHEMSRNWYQGSVLEHTNDILYRCCSIVRRAPAITADQLLSPETTDVE